jgi:DNA polymerase-3 subunit gamma/tau
MLGTVDDTYLLRLLGAVAAGDGAQLMAVADEMQTRSLSFDAALQDLAGLLLKLAVMHAAPDAVDAGQPEHEALAALGRQIDAETVQLYYQIALQGRDDLALAPDEHAGFVMTLLRMLAFRPERAATGVTAGAAAVPLRAPAGGGASAVQRRAFDGDWPALVRQLPVGGAAGELARNSALARHAAGSIELVVPKSMAHLADRSYKEKLKDVLEQHFGGLLALKVIAGEANGDTAAGREAGERAARRAEAARAVQGDRFVQDLVDIFDAKVVGSSIKASGDQG